MFAHSANKTLIRRYYEDMWNQWNYELASELLSREMSFRGSLGPEMCGRAAICDYMRHVQAAFPDFHNRIDQLVGEGDQVVARLTYSGTHRGKLFGIASTGTQVTYAGSAFFRISKGQIAEGWVLGDVINILRQIGARELPPR